MNDLILAEKNKVLKSFSKGVSKYDEKAVLQHRCAKNMVGYLLQHRDILVDGPFLEIGCGTGFVTEGLLSNFPGISLCVTDISESMLHACRTKMTGLLLPLESAVFEILDGEQFKGSKEYSLIISSMVFQWFSNLEASIKALLQGLKPGGVLLFCMPVAKSFPEWQAICQQLNLPFTGNLLPEVKKLELMINSLGVKTALWQESITLKYPSAEGFFRNLKEIGAATSLSRQQLKPHEMKRLMQHWNRLCPEGVSCTSHVAYCLLEKNKNVS